MIKLTNLSGNPLYLSAEEVVLLHPDVADPQNTAIVVGNQFTVVKESPKEVVRKMLEYKLTMDGYRQANKNAESVILSYEERSEARKSKDKHMFKLHRLAGLAE